MWPSQYRTFWDSTSTATDWSAGRYEFRSNFVKPKRNIQATEVDKMFDDIIFDISGKKEIENKEYLNLIHKKRFKAISVRQPWADLIVRGIKNIENRKWTHRYRGPLLIHSPQTFNYDDFIRLKNNPKSARYMYEFDADYVLGCIIGIVTLKQIHSRYDMPIKSEWKEPGFYHFELENALMFKEPVLWRGQLSIFDVEDEYNQIGDQIQKTLVG